MSKPLHPRVCLNMIVKDETPVIERALRSVSNCIDYYVICDTGSTDGTPELIRKVMDELGIQGEIHHRDWVNFGHNRQEALDLAKGVNPDWVLIFDADWELAVSEPDWFSKLVPGTTYQLTKHHDHLRYANDNLLWMRDVGWQWKGVVHEHTQADRDHPHALIEGAWVLFHAGEGVRSRGISQKDKHLADAALLEAEVKKHPDDARSVFYLAQSYRDAGEYQLACDWYIKRADMNGWPEENYVAQCELAKLDIVLKLSPLTVFSDLLKAYAMRPTRAEALWLLAGYCRENQRYAEGYLFAKVGKDIPLPNDILFVSRDVYDWRLLDEFAVCAFWIGQHQESADACRRLISEKLYPPSEEKRIRDNLEFALHAIGDWTC